MAFSFEPFLAISAGHFMAVLSEPEQIQTNTRIYLQKNQEGKVGCFFSIFGSIEFNLKICETLSNQSEKRIGSELRQPAAIWTIFIRESGLHILPMLSFAVIC